MAEQGRKEAAIKLRAVNQNADAAGLDLAGLRMGKTRLVSKRKKQTALKKVLIEERADKRTDQAAAIAAATGGQPAPGACMGAAPGATAAGAASGALVGGLSLEAPEFIPQGWSSLLEGIGGTDASRQAPEAAESAAADDGAGAIAGAAGAAEAAAKATASAATAEALRAAPRTTPVILQRAAPGGVVQAAPALFIPSWCQGQPEEEAAPASASASAPGAAEPAAEAAELPVAEAIERMNALQEADRGRGGARAPAEKKQKEGPPKPSGADIEVRHYVHQLLSEELDSLVKGMVAELVRFQERAKLDELKYQKLKRYCVGMREARRSVARNKAKCIIAAPNLEECSAEGGLDETMEDLIEACRDADIPVVFALSRNRIGKAMGKNMRLSLVCILSAEGVHQEFKKMLKLTDDLRRQWVIQQMAHFTSEDAEEARRRAEEKAVRDAERRERKTREAAEKKAEEERLRAEAKVEKEAAKARKAQERQAELVRRRAQKAEREKAAAEQEAEEIAAREGILQKAEDERRRKQEGEAKVAAERAKKLVAERAAEEKRRAEEEAARKAAGDDSDSDSSGSSVPLGFSANLF